MTDLALSPPIAFSEGEGEMEAAPIKREQGPDAFRPYGRAERLSPKAAQRHSKVVRHLRLMVPAAATALLATYAFSATPPTIDAGFLNNFQQADVESSSMKLDHPRYAGEDLDGLPFEVSAQSAARDPNAPELIDLENLSAMRTSAGKDAPETVNVTADGGLWNTEKKQIDLSENVRLERSFGGAPIVFNTDAAEIDLQTNVVSSSAGVTGTGEKGTIAADTVVVYQNEGRQVLEGNVRLRLNGKTKAGAEDKDPGLR